MEVAKYSKTFSLVRGPLAWVVTKGLVMLKFAMNGRTDLNPLVPDEEPVTVVVWGVQIIDLHVNLASKEVCMSWSASRIAKSYKRLRSSCSDRSNSHGCYKLRVESDRQLSAMEPTRVGTKWERRRCIDIWTLPFPCFLPLSWSRQVPLQWRPPQYLPALLPLQRNACTG